MRFVMLCHNGVMLAVLVRLDLMLVVLSFGFQRLGLRRVGLGMLDDIAAHLHEEVGPARQDAGVAALRREQRRGALHGFGCLVSHRWPFLSAE